MGKVQDNAQKYPKASLQQRQITSVNINMAILAVQVSVCEGDDYFGSVHERILCNSWSAESRNII